MSLSPSLLALAKKMPTWDASWPDELQDQWASWIAMFSDAARAEGAPAADVQTDEYRVWMEPLPANPGGFALEGGWYGRPGNHVGMDNRGIWWRTTEDRALVMDLTSAILAVKGFREKGYRCRCDPPITVTVTY